MTFISDLIVAHTLEVSAFCSLFPFERNHFGDPARDGPGSVVINLTAFEMVNCRVGDGRAERFDSER
jgi:hypothetical protein